MFIPQVYAVALVIMVLSMLCWGSWANSFKLCKNWRFELFYRDCVWGLLLVALILGLTFGRTDPASADSFFQNLGIAGSRNLAYAFLAGSIFNVANILLVAAIEIAGLAVAFPIGIGLALVIGSVLNYIVTPKGHPLFLFGGIALVRVAIVFDALAYRKLSADVKVTTKGIVLSLFSGVGIGLFYPFIAKAIVGENHLGPYTVMFVFALGILVSTISVNYTFMRRPVTGAPPFVMAAYFAGRGIVHIMGSSRWVGLGYRHHCKSRSVLCADGRSRHLLRARPGRDDGFGAVGSLCVEGIPRRGPGSQVIMPEPDLAIATRGGGPCTYPSCTSLPC
jgi:glucose uptake protein